MKIHQIILIITFFTIASLHEHPLRIVALATLLARSVRNMKFAVRPRGYLSCKQIYLQNDQKLL